jgi:hypothetical protein
MKPQPAPLPVRTFQQPNRLWGNPVQHPTSLGCRACPEYARCGGIHTDAGVYDCNDLCNCPDENKCDLVCRSRPEYFVQRVREVGGLDLDSVPRAALTAPPSLPKVIPFIDHKYSRNGTSHSPVVGLPLYRVVDMAKGKLHIRSRDELADRFHISADAMIVLSGVDKDRYIERWWHLPNREEILGALRMLGIGLLTTPNYSVLTDVPRTDNLYAIKRIALTWTEMANAGLPAALHVNARTERDYVNWARLIAERDEIAALAFEFATGCGRPERIDWHVDQLCNLALKIGRPMTLVVRGGGSRLHTLRQHFSGVTLLETESFSRTLRRRRAWISAEGKLRWAKSPTPVGAALDDLFAHNAKVVRDFYEAPVEPAPRLRIPRQVIRRAPHRDNQSIQPGLLDNLHMPGQARPIASDRHRVITTAKT